MRISIVITAVVGILLAVVEGHALAQQPASAVQLPTFSQFSTATTVSVPDRGSVLLGGVDRAATGRNEFGTPLAPLPGFGNRSIGSNRSAASTRVSVFIHDFEAMDEYLLSQPTGTRSLHTTTPRQYVDIGRGLRPRDRQGRTIWDAPPAEDRLAAGAARAVAEEQARREAVRLGRDKEAVEFFERGQEAEEAGKANVAKIYYQMAARRAAGPLKTEAVARLEAIAREETNGAVVHAEPTP